MTQKTHEKVILILENDSDIASSFQEWLEGFDPRISYLSAADIGSAEELFEAHKKKIVLFFVDDYPHDRMVLGAFVSYMKQDPDFKGDLVAFTASSDILKDPVKYGYDEVLPKPFELEQLEELVVKHSS